MWVNGTVHLKPVFTREAQDWESESMTDFLDDLYAAQVNPNVCDKLIWLPSPQGRILERGIIECFK